MRIPKRGDVVRVLEACECPAHQAMVGHDFVVERGCGSARPGWVGFHYSQGCWSGLVKVEMLYSGDRGE